MNIFHVYKQEIITALSELYPDEYKLALPALTLEVPKDRNLGDLATNAALVLAKPLGRSPKDIAQEISLKLVENSAFDSVVAAGPGFINIRLSKKVWGRILTAIFNLQGDYGRNNIGHGATINIEFVSANPTGPMHIGHARGAIVGDVLANLMVHCGYKVVREYYINDAGVQIEVLARSLLIRYQQQCGIEASIPSGCYPGEYLIPVAEQLYRKYERVLLDMPEGERFNILQQVAVAAMLQLIRADLALLGVHHDIFRSEQHDIRECNKLEEVLSLLQAKGVMYQGVLDAPKGKLPEDWESREQLLFKATQFGDDVDRPMQKSDGNFTYFAADSAYHLDKLQRGFDNMVVILGADHGGYVKRLKAVIAALSDGKAQLDVLLNQLVNLLQDGRPFKMSKRAGTFVTVSDVLEILDRDILRFVMLSRKCDTILDLDFTKAQEQSKDNPVFYVQYAYTRTCSVLSKAQEASIFIDKEVNCLLLAHDFEISLISKIAEYARVVETAAAMHEPHKLPYYLYELATEFHSWWNKGVEEAGLRFIVPNDVELSKARCMLVSTVAQVLRSGMELMGVTPLERM